MKKHKVGGWVDFWVGLVVFSLFFMNLGYLAYQHRQADLHDAAEGIQTKLKSKSSGFQFSK